MKKTILYLLLLFSCSLSVKSQINTSLYSFVGVSTFEEQFDGREVLYDPKLAVGIGFGINFPLKNNFSLSTSLNLQSKQGGLHYIEYTNTETIDQYTTTSIVSFSLPVVLQYSIPFKKSKIIFGAGGYLGVNLLGVTYFGPTFDSERPIIYTNNPNSDFNVLSKENSTESIKLIDYGYYFSVEYHYKKFLVGINSEIGARNISKLPSNELKFTTYSLMLKVGLKFIKKKKELVKEKQ